MCLLSFIKFTFSTKEAFHRALKKIHEDGLGECPVKGELFLIADADGLDLKREPYEVLKDKTLCLHIAFFGWDKLKELMKKSNGYAICGEITIEIRNGWNVKKYA